MTGRNAVLEMWLGGVWTAVPLYSAAGTTVTRGHEPDGSWPRPTKIECEINNDSLAYDPSRPESALYGVAGRNTKSRLTVDGNWRVWAEASSWVPDKTPDHVPGVRGRSWTDLTAEGVLRRIGMWTDPLRSPMYRTISARATSVGHWSLEDDRAALTVANSSSSGPATIKGGAVLGESEAPLGASQTVKTANGSQLTGRFVSASTTAGWQIAFSMRLPALPPSSTYQLFMRWQTSVGYTWFWDVNDTTYRINVRDSDGTLLFTNNVLFGAGAEPTKWVTFRLKAFQSGGNVQLEPAWYAQGMSSPLGVTDVFAGSVGGLRQWWQDGNSVTDGAHFSHVFGVTTVADDLLSLSNMAVFNGYLGERVYDRFGRLCDELGVTRFMIGASADTQPMGPQRADTFLALLREIRDTEGGRIDDERFDIGLTLRTRRSMYNQAAALTLTYPSQVAVPFGRIIDDLNTHNVVTVKNGDGGEVTAALTTGVMSVQAPPAGVGEYKQSIDVNVANESLQLLDIATWHRARGTLERPRYAEVTVDLLANPSLVASAVAVREGDMIQVDGAEPDPVRLLVVGMVERVGAVTWTITYQTELYDPYRIGVYDDGVWRWDNLGSVLVGGYSTTFGTFTVTVPNGSWSAATPYDIVVGGERCRVNSVFASGGNQGLNVTRSINGVVKTHVAGEEVHVYESRRWGL